VTARRGSRGRRSVGGAPRGLFLVLEGLDGAGTTTQAARLCEALRREGRQVHVTAEPSGGPIGALVRQVLRGRLGGGAGGREGFDPRALALLFAADRLDHVNVEIAPKLAAGMDVVCDRFTLSSLAYQGAALGELDWVAALNRAAARPDATLFLQVRPEVALRRRQAASVDREIFEVDAFQRKVARSYRDAIRRIRRSGERVIELDGEVPVDDVAAAVLAAVHALR
jgi:dTMP kinase